MLRTHKTIPVPKQFRKKTSSQFGFSALASGGEGAVPVALLILVLVSSALSLPATHTGILGQPKPTILAGSQFGPGTVCLNDPSNNASANPCPKTPFIFNGPYPSTPQTLPTQIRVGVYVNNSASFYGMDITLLANHTVLQPTRVDFAGTILVAGQPPSFNGLPYTLLECFGGRLALGPVCSPTDSPDTLHVAALVNLGGRDTIPPTTGLLFTAIYNITGTSPSGGIPVGFQTGCNNTSVSGGVCVTLSYAPSPSPDTENIQSGTIFNNFACSTDCTWFAITTNVTSTTFLYNSNVGNHVLLTARAPNGVPFLGNDSITFTAATNSSSLNVFIFPTSCNDLNFTANSSCSVNATLTAFGPGVYSVIVYGRYQGDNCGPTGPCSTLYSLVGLVSIQANVQGVGWTVEGVSTSAAQTFYFEKGALRIPYTFTSIAGYSGTLALSTSLCNAGTTGATCPALLPPAFTISSGSSVTKLINFTASAYGSLQYRDSLTATGLPRVTPPVDALRISGIGMTANTTSVSVIGGTTVGHVGVTLTSLGATNMQFNGLVTMGFSSSPGGVSVSCFLTQVSLTPGSTQMNTCTLSSSMLGNYSLAIIGSGGANIVNQTTVAVNVLPNISIKNSGIFQGLNITTTVSLSVNATASTVSGVARVVAANATTRQLVYANNYTMTVVNIQHAPNGQVVQFLLNIPVSPYALSADIQVILGQNSNSSSVTLSREIAVAQDNFVSILDIEFVQHSFNSVQGGPGYDARADLAAHGMVDIFDVTLADSFFNASVFY